MPTPEAKAREKIDELLTAAGWQVQVLQIRSRITQRLEPILAKLSRDVVGCLGDAGGLDAAALELVGGQVADVGQRLVGVDCGAFG